MTQTPMHPLSLELCYRCLVPHFGNGALELQLMIKFVGLTDLKNEGTRQRLFIDILGLRTRLHVGST